MDDANGDPHSIHPFNSHNVLHYLEQLQLSMVCVTRPSLSEHGATSEGHQQTDWSKLNLEGVHQQCEGGHASSEIHQRMLAQAHQATVPSERAVLLMNLHWQQSGPGRASQSQTMHAT